jgi:hypothetical protein
LKCGLSGVKSSTFVKAAFGVTVEKYVFLPTFPRVILLTAGAESAALAN